MSGLESQVSTHILEGKVRLESFECSKIRPTPACDSTDLLYRAKHAPPDIAFLCISVIQAALSCGAKVAHGGPDKHDSS